MAHKIEAILDLARQYQLPTWLYQSLPSLDPYLLASIGYKPTAPLELQCHICHHKVNIPEQPEQQLETLTNQLYQHQQNCIYHGQKQYKLTKEDLYEAIEGIYLELNENSTSECYPLLKTESIWRTVGLNKFLMKKVMALYQIDTDKYLISFFLRLFGWQFVKKDGKGHALTCHFCGQNRLLEEMEATENTNQDPELEAKTEQDKLFDPIQEHRYFCLWTGPEQNWLLLLQDLENKHSQYVAFNFKKSMQPLSMKKMKITIDKYLQSFNEKVQTSLSKMKLVSQQFDKVVQELDKEQAELPQEQVEGARKRLRDLNEGAEQIGEFLREAPSKKVKGQ